MVNLKMWSMKPLKVIEVIKTLALKWPVCNYLNYAQSFTITLGGVWEGGNRCAASASRR